jgi:hypothetical protein
MSLAKGTQSAIVFQEEQDEYAEAPAVFAPRLDRFLSFVNEGLGGSINQLISEEIRHDRAVAAVRGGNIAANGSLTTEFGPLKNGVLLKHLMGKAQSAFVPVTIQPFTVDRYYDRGVFVYATDDVPKTCAYVCIVAGKTGSISVDGLTSTEETQTHGTTVWRLIGDVNSDFGYIEFAPQITEDFLEKGLTIEKQLEGGDSNSYIQFSGVRVNSLALNFPQEGIVRADWALVAMKQDNLDQVFFSAPEYKYLTGELVNVDTDFNLCVFDASPTNPPVDGDRVRFTADVMPTGLSADIWYYMRDVDAVEGKFKVALTSDGAAVTISTTGTNVKVFADGTPLDASTDQPFAGSDFMVLVARSAAATLIGNATNEGHVTENLLLDVRPVREASLTISNQFDENIFTTGVRSRAEIPEGVRSITGSLTMYFKDGNEFGAFIGEETVTLEFLLLVGGFLLKIRLPYCKITGDGTPKIASPGVLTATYNFTAFKLGNEDDINIRVYGLEDSLLLV